MRQVCDRETVHTSRRTRSTRAGAFDKGSTSDTSRRAAAFCVGGGRHGRRTAWLRHNVLEAGYHELNRVQMQAVSLLTKKLAAAHQEARGGRVRSRRARRRRRRRWWRRRRERRRRVQRRVAPVRRDGVHAAAGAGVAAAQGGADARVARIPGAGRGRQAARAPGSSSSATRCSPHAMARRCCAASSRRRCRPRSRTWCTRSCLAKVVVNAAVDTVEQSLVFCGREDGKLVALRQMVREGLAAAAGAHLRAVHRAGDAALPRARVRRAGRGRAARGAHGRARPAAAADAASGGGAAPYDAEDVPS